MDMYKSITRNINRFGSKIELITKVDGAIDFSTGKYIQTETREPMLGIIGHYTSSDIIEGVINIDDIKCTIQTDKKAIN